MPTASGSVGVEGERLVAVLERAVGALELLAMLPTPETSVSFTAFLLHANDGDDSSSSASATAAPLARDAHEALSSHFRLEASLAEQASERQQRCASAATTASRRGSPRSTTAELVDDPTERPEVDDVDGEIAEQDNEHDAADEEGDGKEEEEEEDHDDALRFPRSLHDVLDLLTHDKPTRDTLRRLSATRVSPDVAACVHCLTDLIMLRERALDTTPEQDDLAQRQLRDASQRLVELHDDAAQLRFELAAEREARQAHALTHGKSISHVREQLSETQRHASEALRATQRTRDHDAQAVRAQYETDKRGVHEKTLALARVDGRVADAHEAEEGDDRKRAARAVADLHELLATYDDEVRALDDALAQARAALRDEARDVARLATYFERVDEDRHHQVVEQRAREEDDARRRHRELNLFKFTTRVQALVRGFLTRRRVRLDETLQKQRRQHNKTKKTKKTNKTTKTTKTTTKGRIHTSLRTPSRPGSAALTPRRPSTATAAARRGA